jgi:23S rRNA (uridine2552-2'-O)-methyltransferase
MAPNLSGISSTDHARSLELVSQALNFALQTLKPQGALLLKAFLGPELNEFKNVLRQHFAEVKLIKPKASRSRSEELFLLAQQFEV